MSNDQPINLDVGGFESIGFKWHFDVNTYSVFFTMDPVFTNREGMIEISKEQSEALISQRDKGYTFDLDSSGNIVATPPVQVALPFPPVQPVVNNVPAQPVE